MNEGMLHVTQFTNALGMPERYEYRWDGGPRCQVSRQFIDDAEIYWNKERHTLLIGPYLLKIIEEQPYWDWFDCIRLDYPFWWVVVGRHKINRLLDLTYHRAIITLAIWGLASFNRASIPHWRDIYLLQNIEKFIRNLRGKH